MPEQISLSCRKCSQIFNEYLEDARKYNKDNPYICQQCETDKGIIQEQGNLTTHQDISEFSRLYDSQTLNDPEIISNAQQKTPEDISPIFPPRNNLEGIEVHIKDFESKMKGDIQERLDDFRIRRERIERELREEMERVDHYDHDHGGVNWIGILPMLCIIPFILIMFGAVQSAIVSPIVNSTATTITTNTASNTSVDCSKLSGNAGPNETIKNATGDALECLLVQQQITFSTTLLMISPIVIITIMLIVFIRIIRF